MQWTLGSCISLLWRAQDREADDRREAGPVPQLRAAFAGGGSGQLWTLPILSADSRANAPGLLRHRTRLERRNTANQIEQVREIEQQFVYRPLVGERKICLIDDADRLTIGAANALLKTLEEPPGHSLFILVTSRLHALPITIRSRCQALRFTTPARTQVEAALILKRELPPADARFLAVFADGRIGEALTANVAEVRAQQQECLTLVKMESLTSSAAILSSSESLAKTDRGEETLAWLARWIRDLVIVMVDGDQDQILHLDQLADLRRYAQRADIDSLLTILNDIERTEQQATRHLNLQMALETTFLRLREALALVPSGVSA